MLIYTAASGKIVAYQPTKKQVKTDNSCEEFSPFHDYFFNLFFFCFSKKIIIIIMEEIVNSYCFGCFVVL